LPEPLVSGCLCQIPESWFEEAGVEGVRAFKCPSTEIQAELSEKYSTYRVYTLRSDGFSTWVVGGTVESAPAETTTVTTTVTTVTTATTTPPVETTTPPAKPTPGFEVVIAIAGLLAVAYLLRRR
jgi:PGF-CTERM protein